ncbi:MAG TPA: glycosyl hydrolase family 43 [Xanthomonadaceae bacterium]|nr:glycosyl hydrolase family 43 [Xanthomonadaceae bacterium]
MIFTTSPSIRFRAALAIAVAGLAAAACTVQAGKGGGVPIDTAPALDEEFADPFVLPIEDGSLVAFATNRTEADGRRTHVPMSRSRDGKDWTAPAEVMPTAPRWARTQRPDIWAPEAARIGDRYVLFFSARHATRSRPDGLTLCIGAAVAERPEGPYLPQPEPLTCGGAHGVIDASPVREVDASGRERLWLLYKTDGNCCGTQTTFIAQRLRTDGLALLGPPHAVAGLRNDRPWEGKVIEAPQMVREHGRLWLFYAGNDYGGAAYATGYARCESILGPCRDAAENPILHSRRGDPALVGPGHQSVFRHAGRTWIAYHGWRPATASHPRYRAMYVQPLTWRGGRPVVGD